MDNVIESVGAFGRFQYKVILIIGLISALSSLLLYATIFIAAEPTLICTYNDTSFTRLNATLNDDKQEAIETDECKIWTMIQENKTNKYSCHFDKTYYDKTIINEWGLICDRSYRASLTQTVHIFGSIFGFFGGILGDRYGRRKSVLIFFILLTFTLIVSQFLLSNIIPISIDARYIIYSICQFLVGLLVNCLYCTAYVLLLEFTTEKYRTIISNLNSYIYVFGELIALVVYYVSRDWHILNWFIALYSLALLIISYFFLPESPAWLLSLSKKKSNERAFKILKEMAKANGKKNYQISESIIEEMKQTESLIINENDDQKSLTKVSISNENGKNGLENLLKQINNEDDDSETNSEFVSGLSSDLLILKQIFTPLKNLIKTSLLFFIWIALMLIYYGISLGVTSIDHVDPYLMYFLSCIAEIIGYVCCYANDFLGRKKTISCFLLVTTLMYGFIAFFSEFLSTGANDHFSTKGILLMVFGLIGKCAVSGSYNIAYIYTSELYPTSTRNTAVLFLICFGGISSLVAPQINMLKTLVWNPLPYIIYSTFALLSVICVWYLPETKITK